MFSEYIDYQHFNFELNGNYGYTLVKASEDLKGHILIPSFYKDKPITCIDDYAFFMCENIKSIVIPNTVHRIGCCAFAECSLLEKLEFKGYVELIDKEAFYNCINLNTIKFRNNIGKIRRDAFENCFKIEFLELEEDKYSLPEKDAFDLIFEDKYF